MAYEDIGGDSFTPGDPPHGFCIAFDDDALEEFPTWTRIDDPAADWRLRLSSFAIDRGSDSDTDTIKTGTAVATLADPFGTMDPTNTSSPFWDGTNHVTKLNPCLQAAYARFNPVDGTWSTRFRGHVKAFRGSMDTSGFPTITIELVDLFDLLADLWLTPGDQGDTPRTESVGDIFYAGGSPIPANNVFKHVDQRLNQAADDAGIPTSWRDFFSGNVTVQEVVVERDGGIIQVFTDAADAEFPDISRMFVSRDGVLSFRGRFARFFPTHPGYGIGHWYLGGQDEADADAALARLSNFTWRRSSEDIINVATAIPKGLADTDVPTNKVRDFTSIDKYGRRPWVADNLLTWQGHDDVGATIDAAPETKKFATFKVDNYKDPKTRIEQITVTFLRPDAFNGTAQWAFLQGVELGDLLSIATTHRGGGGFDEDYYVERIQETDEPGPSMGVRKVTMVLDVSPRAFYSSNPFGTVDAGVS